MKIILFSRQIRSGKTTELTQWCKQQPNIDGILMPDVNGLRHMQRVATGEIWKAQCEDISTSETVLNIGRFSFYEEAFNKANNILLAISPTNDFLVIDEIGKLELKQQGFYSSLTTILHHQPAKNLLLVVRDSLVKEVVASFGIGNFRLVHHCSEIV